MKKLTQLCLLLLFTTMTAFSQVEYQIEWLENTETYQVSMKSNATWDSPYNITSTAQITVKVPTGDFEVSNVVNLISDVIFEPNSRYNAPEESPDFDYISFGLKNIGTDKLSYQEGVVLPLFTFQNSGTCNGEIYLIDDSDAFMPPNTVMANVGNQITTLGSGGTNAWVGNTDTKADCSLTNTIDTDQLKASFNIFPNPADDRLNIHFDWPEPNEDILLNIFDTNGKTVQSSKQTFTNGKNTLILEIKDMRSGAYTLEIQSEDLKMVIDRFVKL